MIKAVVILFILIGMAYAASQMFEIIETEDGQFQVAIDSAMKQAIEKGEFQFPDNIVPIESKDCEGTQWIKQQECSLNGKSMDGTEGSCGPGKEIWILDQTHSGFKPATGDGKCEPEERDCNVECPKPCEGDTWKDSGKCTRREYDTRGNMKEIVLDGTEGKCGEGITEFTLDTTAPDYKPAVGKGSCPLTKGGACNVPCPKPEPPKCNSYGGWIENTGLGCVINENSSIKVNCGQTGVKQKYKIATNPTVCEELIEWETCTGKPCPIDCVGSWSGWSAPKSDESCGVQPYKEKTYTVTTQAQHGGQDCGYTHNDTKTLNAGSVTPCCIQGGDWAEKPGTCNSKGLAIYTQSFTENKPGGCPDSAKSKKMACCYKKGDWEDITGCNSIGKKTQQQTTAGNCVSSVKTRPVDCPVNCEGYYENPACPAACKGSETSIVKRWITTREPMNGGAACPSDSTKNCSGELDCTPTIPSGWNDENECYLARYVDLRAAFGKNISAAGRHWNSYGSGEGRNRSCTLSDKEAECYATRYSDVDAGSGLNEVRRHYYETGMGEHRDFTCEPGVKELTCYVKRYPDLQNAFGTNYNITNSWNHTLYRALNHWNVFGKREGRNISCS